MRKSLKKTLLSTLILKDILECPFCCYELMPDDDVVQFPCFETHLVHKNCYNAWLEHTKKTRKPLRCVFCRKDFTEAQVKSRKIEIEEEEPAPIMKMAIKHSSGFEEMFGQQPQDKKDGLTKTIKDSDVQPQELQMANRNA